MGRQRGSFDDFDEWMLLSDEELAGELERETPGQYSDPVLARDQEQYISFLKELRRCGVIGCSSWVECVCGLFFVSKKNKKLRLIIDARRANVFFRRPPSGENSSLAALGNLRVPRGEKLYISQYDVRDFFYRLGIPWKLARYFGLPPLTLDEAAEIFSARELETCRSGACVYPFFQVLPMGFSWAFFLAQEALREVVTRSLVGARFVTDFTRAPCLHDPTPVVMIYADNGNHLGLSREKVNDERALVDAELNRVGLATHEVVGGWCAAQGLSHA